MIEAHGETMVDYSRLQPQDCQLRGLCTIAPLLLSHVLFPGSPQHDSYVKLASLLAPAMEV